MPYDVKKIDGKYCVVKQGTNDSKGCHKTRGEAVDQLRALYANEAMSATSVAFEMSDVESAIRLIKLGNLDEAIAALGGDPSDLYLEESNEEFAGSETDLEEFPWEGPIVFENVVTGDNRVFQSGSINWEPDTLPWAFRWQKHSGQGHAGSVPVGRVDRIERKDDGSIYGYGVVIPGLSDEATEYKKLLESGVGGGVSVDGDTAQFDVKESDKKDSPPRIEFSSMRLRALSAVDIPAFNGARIRLSGTDAADNSTEEFGIGNMTFATVYKTDGGEQFPASAYAYVPDPSAPSTWKLRLWATPGGGPDAGIVGAAIAALGKGFRGNKVEIPAADLPAVKAKVRAAWVKANPDKSTDEMPDVIRASAEELDVEIEEFAAVTKTDGGESFPASAYAYVPDPSAPSTWKLRLWATPGGGPDAGIVGAAIAALGKGFRGNKVQIPAADLPAVKAKVRAAWVKANPDKSTDDMPDVIRASGALEDEAEDAIVEFGSLPPALQAQLVKRLKADLAKETDPKKKAEIEAKLKKYGAGSKDSSSDTTASDDEVVELEFNPVEELAKKKSKKNSKKYSWNFEALVASAIPTVPTTDYFLDPEFDGPTALTVDQDGRVYGHLALFNTCHIGFPGTCVKPPKGSDYRYFHTGEIETAEGEIVDVGHLTFGTGHASMNGTPKGAAEHYDNTGTVAADVRAGEDEFGIWVVGALRPGLSAEQIREFRAAPLSGDWRKIAGRLELVGALAVNVPGFPVPRVRAMVASGETEALVTFLEAADFQAEYEARVLKKVELAGKLEDLLNSDVEVPSESEVDLDEILKAENPPKAPSKKELEEAALNLTPAQVKEALKGLRLLLDDPEETISKTNRDKLEALYEFFLKNDETGALRSSAESMELELFTYGIELEEITASGLGIVEFYNQCHDKGGLFCEGPDGPGRVRDNGGGGGRLKGRHEVAGNPHQPNQRGREFNEPHQHQQPLQPRPQGQGQGQGQGQRQGQGQGQGQGQRQGQGQGQGQGQRQATPVGQGAPGFGEYAGQAAASRGRAGRSFVASRNSLVSARNWAGAGTLLYAAAHFGGGAASAARWILPAALGSTPALYALAGLAGVIAIRRVAQSAGYLADARSSARRSRRYERASEEEARLRQRVARANPD